MLFKIMLVFLVAMVGIGMVGNVLFPGALSRQVRSRLAGRKATTCPACGRHKIGRTCDCSKKG